MWDDMHPFLSAIPADGPTVTVLDPGVIPNHILDSALGGSVKVEWSFVGPSVYILDHIQFTVTLYADPVGTGSNQEVGKVASAIGRGPFSETIPIPPSDQPGGLAAGVYRLTTLITSVDSDTGETANLAGFTDGPIIQVRP